ncbi:MAG: hypothetical protein ABI808_12050 [Pseudonocardiales bacterium]
MCDCPVCGSRAMLRERTYGDPDETGPDHRVAELLCRNACTATVAQLDEAVARRAPQAS